MYYIYGRVRAIPTYRVYRLYDTYNNDYVQVHIYKSVNVFCKAMIHKHSHRKILKVKRAKDMSEREIFRPRPFLMIDAT